MGLLDVLKVYLGKASIYFSIGLNISYNGLFTILMVALSYLDLSLDSILLGTVIYVLGSGLEDLSRR